MELIISLLLGYLFYLLLWLVICSIVFTISLVFKTTKPVNLLSDTTQIVLYIFYFLLGIYLLYIGYRLLVSGQIVWLVLYIMFGYMIIAQLIHWVVLPFSFLSLYLSEHAKEIVARSAKKDNSYESILTEDNQNTQKKTLTKSIDEPITVKNLKQQISEKKNRLIELTHIVEQLKIDLSLIRQEYNIKIGRLYLKLDQLDLEISKLTKIRKLMDEGYSLKEAKSHVDEETRSEQEKIDQENEKINEEQEKKENIQGLSEEEMNQLKSLYKDLVKKFHPDLVFDEAEKKKRQEIMKAINKAYREHDLAELKRIASKQVISEGQEDSIEVMQSLLKDIVSSVEKLQQEYKSLQESEWYQWMIRIKNAKGRDLFQELEEKILDDISKKAMTLSKLKN